MMRRSTAIVWIVVLLRALATAAPATQVVRSGWPPPEIRALFDALVTAVNSGKAEAWETFAQARFAPPLLGTQSPAQRADAYRQLVDRFGTIAVERVTREGPDAPLH